MRLQHVVDTAVSALADRLGVPSSDVRVARAEQVTWRDGSIGCPRPGIAYTQALVDGYLVALDVGGRTFSYHAGPDGKPFHCASPQPPLEPR